METAYRIIDANLNRLTEGIRVVEDICRYVYNDAQIAYKLKELRHKSRSSIYSELLNARDAINDCLKPTISSETTRSDLQSIIIANIKRSQESSRVLEEMFKLEDIQESEKYKSIRYSLYQIEKEVIKMTSNSK